jgi:hypothetical protein
MRVIDQGNASNVVKGVVDTAVQQQKYPISTRVVRYWEGQVPPTVNPLDEESMSMIHMHACQVRIELLRFNVKQILSKVAEARRAAFPRAVTTPDDAGIRELTLGEIERLENQVFAAIRAAGISPVPIWVKN